MNYFKNMTVGSVVNWILIVAVAFFIVKDCNREAKYNRELQEAIDSATKGKTRTSLEAEKIAQEANLKGDTVVIFEKAEPIIKTLELKIEDRRRVDSLLKINEVKDGRLQHLSTIYAEANARNLKLEKQMADNDKDTIYRYKDKYLVNTVYRTDTSLIADVWMDATVNRIDYTENKKWIFGRNESRTRIWFNSPYLRPNNLDNLDIVQKDPVFDFSLSVGGKYLWSQKEVLVGPEINLRLKRIGVDVGYYLNPGGDIGNGLWLGGKYILY